MANKLITRIASGVTLLFLGLTIVILLLLAIDFYIIQPTFQDLEVQQATEDGNRVKSAIENEIGNIGNLAIDWARWDDTYIFAHDHNRNYVQSNYPNPAYISQNSNVDLIAIFDQRGKILLQGNYHPDLNQQIELDILSGSEPAILPILAPVLQNGESIEGLLNTSHGIIILSAHPILNSQGQGPSRGVLMMGRFLTRATLDVLAERVQVQFDLLSHDSVRLTSWEKDLFPGLAFSASPSRQEFRQGFLSQIYPDIEKNPVLLLRSQTRGEILAIGKQTRYFLNVVLFLVSFVLLVCLIIYRARMKISEKDLQDSEVRYRTIFANKFTVMLLIDPESAAIVDANPAACAYYGWSLDELKSMKISSINTLPEEQGMTAMALASSGKCNRFLFKHRKVDGTINDVEVYSEPLTIKGNVLLFSIVHDISTRKQAEEIQRESNARLQTVLNSAAAVIYIADMQTYELLFVNDHGLKIFGNDIVGRKCWQALQALDGPCPFCTNDKLLTPDGRSSGMHRWEFQNTVDQRWYDITDRAIQWTDGRMVRMEIAIDITERKRAEEIRLNLERQLMQEQKFESLGRMAGSIAHHYNNLLGVVMGNLELVMEDLPDTTDAAENLAEAMRAARRTSEIGKLMLAYLGQTDARRELLDLAELCRQCLPDLRSGMPEYIDLEPVLPEPGPVVSVNATQIMQIVDNLITNAREAMSGRSGVISLVVRTVSSKVIPDHHFPTDFQAGTVDYACLEVRDAGTGIAEIDIDKIFDPFFSTKFTGRGLGLPVVSGAVKAHGGCVTMESDPDLGCIFRVFLPLSAEPVLQLKPEGSETTFTLQGITVLVVEDEPIVRELTAAILKRMGITPLKAKDGLEAVEVFRQHKGSICCVLCDLTMPRMDGWETLAALRQLAPALPFILVSGYDQSQVMIGEHAEWPQVFLSKPYKKAQLKNALVKAMKEVDTS